MEIRHVYPKPAKSSEPEPPEYRRQNATVGAGHASVWHVLALYIAASAPNFAANALGSDWACTEMASVRDGSIIKTCGVATASSEADARAAALQNAKREFDEICFPSVDCRGHELKVEPLRNSCSKEPAGDYKCYRAVRYTVLESLQNTQDIRRGEIAALDKEIEGKREELALASEKRAKQLELETMTRKLEPSGEGPIEPREDSPDLRLDLAGKKHHLRWNAIYLVVLTADFSYTYALWRNSSVGLRFGFQHWDQSKYTREVYDIPYGGAQWDYFFGDRLETWGFYTKSSVFYTRAIRKRDQAVFSAVAVEGICGWRRFIGRNFTVNAGLGILYTGLDAQLGTPPVSPNLETSIGFVF